MKRYELILFDLDGTLLDSKKDIAIATNYTLKKLGVQELDEELIYSSVGSGVTQLLGQSIEETLFNLDKAMLAQAVQIFRDYYAENCLQYSRWYDGVEEIFEYLKNHKIVLLTNKPRLYTQKILDGLKANSIFLDVICGEDDFPKKPDPTGTLHVIEKNKVPKQKTLLVGDSIVDAQTADKAGIDFAFVTYGFGKIENIKPTYHWDSIRDLMKIG